ncbi:MAG TPA: ATP-binding protein [Dehalococcoidia bacterium]
MSEPSEAALGEQDAAALAVLNREGRLLYASPAALRLLGCTAEELARLDLPTLVHPDDRKALQSAIADLLRGTGGAFTLRIRLLRSGGSWQLVQQTGIGVQGLPEAPALIVAFGAVLEPRRTEQAVLAARTSLAAIFQRLMDGILVQDSSGRMVYANRVAAQMCGFTSARELLAAPARALLQRIALLDEAGQPYPAERLPGRRVLGGEAVPPLTLGLHNRASGEVRWVTVTSTPVDEVLSHSRLVVSVLHDITEHRRVEDELRRAVTLRDTFLAAASHELRTPLTSLQGYLEVTQRRLQRGAPAESAAGGLELALRQVARLTRLVNELLDASRLTRGLFVIEPQPLDLVPLVQRAVEADRLAAQTGHELALTAPEPGPRVNADPDRLEQVLANLLGNARKYSRPEQPISVTVHTGAESAIIAIRDEGIGVPEEDQPHIFEPFHRAGNVDRGLTGFGLGLYVAHEIVRAHGGTLTLASRPGAGSTFTIALPLAPDG